MPRWLRRGIAWYREQGLPVLGEPLEAALRHIEQGHGAFSERREALPFPGRGRENPAVQRLAEVRRQLADLTHVTGRAADLLARATNRAAIPRRQK